MAKPRSLLTLAITTSTCFATACAKDEPSDLECVLTKNSMCGFDSTDAASSISWNRGDVVLTLSWIPLAQTGGVCTPAKDGCYAYSVNGASTLDDVYSADINGIAFLGSHAGRYTLTPPTQDCPVSQMTLTCAGSPSCELAGDYVAE